VSVDRFTPARLAHRYLLRGVIAVGGMGEVHLATDERLQRQVAVKVLGRAFADSPDFVERFRREALTSAGLLHPNIAQVYDYGVDGDAHFIVMEYVHGIDLSRLLRQRGPLAPVEAVDIAAQVCAALSAAHGAGVVHRDIKPGNVIVARDGTVKVTDFGIARSLGDVTLTDAGTVLGTAAYIPPEQARGLPATAASDLYSLGVLLYQMLTGELPFVADSPVAVALRHLDEQVPLPSARAADVPAFLDEVVARATAKSPADRYPDADAMASALMRREPAPAAATQALPFAAGVTGAGPAGVTSVMNVPHAPAQHTAALPAAAHAAPPPRAPQRPTRRPPSRRGATAAIVLLAVVAVALAGFLFVFLNSGTDETPASAGNRPSASDTTQEQQPSPSDSPTTSERPDGRTVPAGVVGQQRDSAVGELISLGVNVRWVLVRSAQPEGQVLGSVPAEGEPMRRGQTVALVVSRGRAAEDANTSWVVPDGLVGLEAKRAESRLADEDIRLTRVTVPSREEPGRVVATWPAAGEQTPDGVVVLVVSGGSGDSAKDSGEGSKKGNDDD